MTPSTTIGVHCMAERASLDAPPAANDHATLSLATLVRLICESVEYRPAPLSFPTFGQSFSTAAKIRNKADAIVRKRGY
jgi:hypothetical protein